MSVAVPTSQADRTNAALKARVEDMLEVRLQPGVEIVRIGRDGDLQRQALRAVANAFSKDAPEDFPLRNKRDIQRYCRAQTDWFASFAILRGGKFAGAYLLREQTARHARGGMELALEGLEDDAIGVQGVALVVSPNYRGEGLGRALREIPAAVGYAFVYGLQAKWLDNLDHWLKKRTLAADLGYCWVTVQVMPKPELISAPAS